MNSHAEIAETRAAATGLRVVAGTLLAMTLLAPAGCHRHRPPDSASCNVALPAHASTVNVISYESPGMPFFGEVMQRCSRGRALQVHHRMLPYEELVSQATISISSQAPSPYHLIHVDDQLLIEWGARGWLSPLDDLVQKYAARYRLDDIPPAIWDQMRVDGHIYAIPAIQNVEILAYRKDLLDGHDLAVPRTFDDLATLCTTLKRTHDAEYPVILMYSKSSNHFTYEFHDLLHSMGGAWFHPDGSIGFNDAVGIAALERMVRLYKECLNPNTVNLTPEDAVIGLSQGQFLLGVIWMNELPQLENPLTSRFAGKFGYAPAPAYCKACPPAGYWAQDSWVIPAHLEVDRDLVFRIAMEGLKPSNEAKATDFALVTRQEIARGETAPYWQAGLQSIAAGATGVERVAYSYIARDALEQFGMEAMLGHLSAKAALDLAAEATRDSMRRQGFTP